MKTRIGLFALFIVFFLLPLCAQAASLYIFPATQDVSVGQSFTLTVNVSSPDRAMNAASGDLLFPSDKLQVLSISKADSVMSLWVQDPTFTNSVAGGDVHFAGIVLNPGFTGNMGNLITITFEAVGEGDASATFSSGEVLANDGNGTNILNGLQSADIRIGPRKFSPSTPASPISTSSSTNTSTVSSACTTATTTTPITAGNTPASNIWKKILIFIIEWWLLILLGLLLLAAIVFLALYIIHRIRKWRVSSRRDLLALEEILHNDLKRIQKELVAEKRGKEDSVRKVIEHIESDIKKDIDAVEDIKKQ